MTKMWMVPNMWEDLSTTQRRDLHRLHKVDGIIKYCTTCDHCFEKRHYTERSEKSPLFLYYEDFPKIGKPKVDSCPRCS